MQFNDALVQALGLSLRGADGDGQAGRMLECGDSGMVAHVPTKVFNGAELRFDGECRMLSRRAESVRARRRTLGGRDGKDRAGKDAEFVEGGWRSGTHVMAGRGCATRMRSDDAAYFTQNEH